MSRECANDIASRIEVAEAYCRPDGARRVFRRGQRLANQPFGALRFTEEGERPGSPEPTSRRIILQGGFCSGCEVPSPELTCKPQRASPQRRVLIRHGGGEIFSRVDALVP